MKYAILCHWNSHEIISEKLSNIEDILPPSSDFQIFFFQNVAATNMAQSQQNVIEKMVTARVMQISRVKNVIVVLQDFMISQTASHVRVWLLALKE